MRKNVMSQSLGFGCSAIVALSFVLLTCKSQSMNGLKSCGRDANDGNVGNDGAMKKLGMMRVMEMDVQQLDGLGD